MPAGLRGQAMRSGLDDLQMHGDTDPDAFDFHQTFARRGDHLGKAAEALDERLGKRLHILARDGAEKEKLEKLIVGEGISSA